MPTRHRALHRAVTAMIATSAALALTGCIPTSPQTVPATHFATGGRHMCAHGAAVDLDGSSRSYVLEGRCGTVVVRGDGITVRLQRVSTLSVEGQSDSIVVDDGIGSAMVKGNGISITADSIGSVQVTGQSNSITAPALGSVVVQGDHNLVTTHVKPSDYRVSGQDDTLTLK